MIINDPKPSKEFVIEDRTFIAQSKNPYGFWYVSENGKEIPDLVFTSSAEAEKGIKAYVNNTEK